MWKVAAARRSNPSVPEAAARISCECVGLARGAAQGLPLSWPPVQMEGRAGQCQLVSRIKTTHLFTEVSCKATGPKQGGMEGMSEREPVGRGREGERE